MSKFDDEAMDNADRDSDKHGYYPGGTDRRFKLEISFIDLHKGRASTSMIITEDAFLNAEKGVIETMIIGQMKNLMEKLKEAKK